MSERPASVWSLFLLANELRRRFADVLAGEPWVHAAGFRPPCVGVLHTVAAEGPVSQRDISMRLGVDPSDLVGVLDILERAGLVERRPDPDDRRRHAVVATEAGVRSAARLAELRDLAEAQVLAALDDVERAELSALLAKALAGVDTEPEAVTSPPRVRLP